MNEYLFEFAVLRYVHDPITAEFLNIGVVVYSRDDGFLGFKINDNFGRLSEAFGTIGRDNYKPMIAPILHRLQHSQREVRKGRSLFGELPVHIEQLLAQVMQPNDSSLRFGGFGVGLVPDLENELERLYERLVLRYVKDDERDSRSDAEVWGEFAKRIDDNVVRRLQPTTIISPNYRHDFAHAFKNEKWHPFEPVSLDLVHPGNIRRKANTWIGNARVLSRSNELGNLHLLLGAPSNYDLQSAYEDSVTSLVEETDSTKVRIYREDQAEELAQVLAELVASHD